MPVALVGLLAAGVLGAPVALYRAHRATDTTARLAAQLQVEQERWDAVERQMRESRQLLDRTQDELVNLVAISRRDDARQRAALDRLEGSLRVLEGQDRAGERIIAAYAGAVVLLEGTVVFEDDAGRPLRYLSADERGQPLRDPWGRAPVSTQGSGPAVTQPILGTGFLVSAAGLMLTSRHVVAPDEGAMLAVAGVTIRSRLAAVRAFFPTLADPVAVEVLRTSEEADVAVLRADVEGRSLPVLPLDRTGREAVAGRPVLLLGYPGGVDLLWARVKPSLQPSLLPEAEADLSTVVARLASRRLIRPYVTWGHLADVREHELAYDAPTTGGGSGGPVVSLEGRVIGINYGMARNFGGASFAVPIQIGAALLP